MAKSISKMAIHPSRSLVYIVKKHVWLNIFWLVWIKSWFLIISNTYLFPIFTHPLVNWNSLYIRYFETGKDCYQKVRCCILKHCSCRKKYLSYFMYFVNDLDDSLKICCYGNSDLNFCNQFVDNKFLIEDWFCLHKNTEWISDMWNSHLRRPFHFTVVSLKTIINIFYYLLRVFCNIITSQIQYWLKLITVLLCCRITTCLCTLFIRSIFTIYIPFVSYMYDKVFPTTINNRNILNDHGLHWYL